MKIERKFFLIMWLILIIGVILIIGWTFKGNIEMERELLELSEECKNKGGIFLYSSIVCLKKENIIELEGIIYVR